MKKILFLLAVLAASVVSRAQPADQFIALIGKADNSEEVTNFVQTYHLEMANNTHYLSKEGIELIFKNGLVNEIKLYHNSPVYGNYQGALPSGLQFGLSPAAVKNLLGKPTLSYSSGYCEYEKNNYLLSCWFEAGVLNQVVLAARGTE